MINKKYEIIIYNDLVHIKNYSKLAEIGSKRVMVDFIDKCAVIVGDYLIINGLDEYEITIKGYLNEIKFINK